MYRLKLVILIALVVLMAVPAGTAFAQEAVLISAQEALEGTGTAVIWDDQSSSDAITYSMTGVTAPAAGTSYEGWVVSDDGSVKLSTGVMAVEDDGSVSHTFDSNSAGYTGRDLIALGDKVLITVEPIPDANPGPSGIVAFADQIPAGGMLHIRHLLVLWPQPADTEDGIIPNLIANLNGAILHGNLSKGSGTLDLIRLHAHHVINAIEGEGGPNYDSSFGDPAGDGVGVLAHAADAIVHADLAIGAAPDDAEIVAHAELLKVNAQNAWDWAAAARDQALNALTASENIARILIGPGGNTVISFLEAALSGIATTGEGGAEQAYVEAQLMATYTLEPGKATTAGPPSPGDTAVPMLAQIALIASVALLAMGGVLVLNARRSRARP